MRLKSPGAPLKFPLLSRNYVIEESDCSSENSQTMEAVKAKSPLEVFEFPEPPKGPFKEPLMETPKKPLKEPPKKPERKLPGHYSVKNQNGAMEEYAQPIPSNFIVQKSDTLIPNNKVKNEAMVPNFVPKSVSDSETLVPKLRRPPPLNTTKLTMKQIEDANYNPFSQNYAILSPSR